MLILKKLNNQEKYYYKASISDIEGVVDFSNDIKIETQSARDKELGYPYYGEMAILEIERMRENNDLKSEYKKIWY